MDPLALLSYLAIDLGPPPPPPLYLWSDGVDTMVACSAEHALQLWREAMGVREDGLPPFTRVPPEQTLRVDMSEDPTTPAPTPECCTPPPGSAGLGHTGTCPVAQVTRTAQEWCRWWWEQGYPPGLLCTTDL